MGSQSGQRFKYSRTLTRQVFFLNLLGFTAMALAVVPFGGVHACAHEREISVARFYHNIFLPDCNEGVALRLPGPTRSGLEPRSWRLQLGAVAGPGFLAVSASARAAEGPASFRNGAR